MRAGSSWWRWLVALSAAAALIGAAAGIAWSGARHASRARAAGQDAAAPPASPANLSDAATHDQLAALERAHAGTVLLEFHASWCKPCQELGPRIVALARAHPELLIVRIDASSGAAPLANEYGAETLPLLVKVVAGAEADRRIGAPSQDELERWLAASSAGAVGASTQGGAR